MEGEGKYVIVAKEGKGCGSRRGGERKGCDSRKGRDVVVGKEGMWLLERKERDVVVGDGGERKVCDSWKGRKGMW